MRYEREVGSLGSSREQEKVAIIHEGFLACRSLDADSNENLRDLRSSDAPNL